MSEAFSPLLPAWKFRFSAVTEGNREFGFVVCSLVPLLHLLTSWLKFSGWGARNVSQNVFRLSVFSARFLPVKGALLRLVLEILLGSGEEFFLKYFFEVFEGFWASPTSWRFSSESVEAMKKWHGFIHFSLFNFLFDGLLLARFSFPMQLPSHSQQQQQKKKRNWLLIQKEKENEREIKRKTKYFASRPADRVSYCENGPAYKNQRLHRHRRSHFKRQTHFWIKYWIYWFSPCFAGWLMSRMEFDAADFNNNRNKIVTWCVNFAIISAAETFDRWKRSRAPIRLFTVLHFF